MRARILDSKSLSKLSLKQIKEIYAGKSLDHMTCENLKNIYQRISLESDLIPEPYGEKKFDYLYAVERYFKLLAQVRSHEQLTLF